MLLLFLSDTYSAVSDIIYIIRIIDYYSFQLFYNYTIIIYIHTEFPEKKMLS